MGNYLKAKEKGSVCRTILVSRYYLKMGMLLKVIGYSGGDY